MRTGRESLNLNMEKSLQGFTKIIFGKPKIKPAIEIDEMIIPLLLFFVFLFIDVYRRSKKVQVENAKLGIYKAMLSSSHHILNNFIYQMDIFKMTAEDTPGFDAKILAFYEDIISNTSDQIHSLSNLSIIDEYNIRSSVLQAG